MEDYEMKGYEVIKKITLRTPSGVWRVEARVSKPGPPDWARYWAVWAISPDGQEFLLAAQHGGPGEVFFYRPAGVPRRVMFAGHGLVSLFH